LRELLYQLKSEGMSIFLNSHQLADVEALCDRVAIIDHGRILKVGPPQSLFDEPLTLEVHVSCVSKELLHRLGAVSLAVRQQENDPCKLLVEVQNEEDAADIADIVHACGARLYALAPQRRSLEQFRSYLLLLARLQLGDRPRNRIEPSDIVQQTLLEAHAQLDQFHGDDSDLAAWLRQALVNNLRDAWRAMHRERRDIRREQALEEAVEQSSLRLEGMLIAAKSSPSERAVRNEELLRLADALIELPEVQREAIVLHHLQGCSLAETARRLDRTDAAVAGLLHRGLRKLRELLAQGE